MRRLAGLAVVAGLVAPSLVLAQSISVREGADQPTADIIRSALAGPHVVRTGSGRLDLPRDSTIASTLVVLGRPTYLASRVMGDVIVVGADLFLRPGADITGRAVAIGGTVALTTLGRVAGGTDSFADETYVASPLPGGGYALDYHRFRAEASTPVLQPAGLQGLLMPTYDRVDGLSLPVGALITLGPQAVEIQPALTYRSRLGTLDPSADVDVFPDRAIHAKAHIGRDTRTNDAWNYSNLVNSATTFFVGIDTRNYFRRTGGEGRVYGRIERPGLSLEPYVGGRYENVRPISANGNVYSVVGRKDPEKMLRPNPLVAAGSIGSALLGAQLYDTAGVVTSRLRAEVERSLTTVTGTRNFTQLTLDGRVAFPTFGTQSLHVRFHTVVTGGDSVTSARYAYLGGSGTLPVVELLEFGGGQLLFLENRYLIPIDRIVLPFVGTPIVTLRHIMGSAGVKRLPSLEQEVGIGLGLSALRLDVTFDASGDRKMKVGIGLSLTQ